MKHLQNLPNNRHPVPSNIFISFHHHPPCSPVPSPPLQRSSLDVSHHAILHKFNAHLLLAEVAHFRLRVPSGNQWVPCKHSASKEHCILEAKELPSSPSPPSPPQLHIRASERDNWFLVDQASFGTMMLRLLTRPALKLEWLDGADGCENYLERER